MEFIFWAPMLLVASVAAAISYWTDRGVAANKYRWIRVTLGFMIGIAASEAAGFHEGTQALRWFVVAVVLSFLWPLVRALP